MTQALALVVDDNETNREIFRLAIERAGYAVDEAHHGQAALEYLSQKSYHLMILDLQMPIMDGTAVLNHFANNGRDPHMQILVITANPHMTRDELVMEQADHVMHKPIDVMQLTHFAQRLLSAK